LLKTLTSKVNFQELSEKNFVASKISFLSPNQHHESTEDKATSTVHISINKMNPVLNNKNSHVLRLLMNCVLLTTPSSIFPAMIQRTTTNTSIQLTICIC